MKTNIFSLAFLLLSVNASAQTITYTQTVLEKHNFLNYLGTFNGHHYFKSGARQYTRFLVSNTKTHEVVKFELEKDDYYLNTFSLLNGQFIALSYSTEAIGETKMSHFKYAMTYLNPATGKQTKSKLYEFKDSSKKYFSFKLDTLVKRIFIMKSDSVITAFNYQLDEANDVKPGKSKTSPYDNSDFVALFRDLFKGLNMTITLGDDIEKGGLVVSDSTSMDFYKIYYEKRKDKDIFFFKHVLQKIAIKSKNPENKVKSVEFGIDIEKSIIDINFREDKNGNLLLFGKYMVKGNTSSEYGMYSVVYDKQLNEVKGVKYFDLNNIYNFTGSVPNKKYIGFIFSKLYDADYEFFLQEENTYIFTYQKMYTNLQDHVYLLKVEANGQITVNVIPNQLNNPKKGQPEPHLALRVGNNIHILFYDHKDNIGKKIRDDDFVAGDMNKKSCVLAYTTYSVNEDEFSKKTLIADKKTLKVLPDLDDPALYFDPQLNHYVCMLEGRDKKGNLKMLYTFMYVE